eukprot:2272710-Amphidinium_carterae.1
MEIAVFNRSNSSFDLKENEHTIGGLGSVKPAHTHFCAFDGRRRNVNRYTTRHLVKPPRQQQRSCPPEVSHFVNQACGVHN